MSDKYLSVYEKNGLEVFVNPYDFWADYKVNLNGKHAKDFLGETAWMDVTRFVHDQAANDCARDWHCFVLCLASQAS